jgi:hypothetical protein
VCIAQVPLRGFHAPSPAEHSTLVGNVTRLLSRRPPPAPRTNNRRADLCNQAGSVSVSVSD